jgi:hypothetical protein
LLIVVIFKESKIDWRRGRGKLVFCGESHSMTIPQSINAYSGRFWLERTVS